MSSIIQEIYSRNEQIPVEVNIYSKTLYGILNSTKQIDEKNIRNLIAWIKQQKDEEKTVESINWVSADNQIADVFTKKGVKTDAILRVVTNGNLSMY